MRPSLHLLLVEWRAELQDEYQKIPDALSYKSEELRDFSDFLAVQRQEHFIKLPAMLQFSIDGLKCEDDDLQIEHLLALRNSLMLHFRTVLQTLSGFTSKDLEMEGKGKLAELIRVLLAKCTHTNLQVRKHSVACLGQLSAIEPSRIPPMERLPQVCCKSPISPTNGSNMTPQGRPTNACLPIPPAKESHVQRSWANWNREAPRRRNIPPRRLLTRAACRMASRRMMTSPSRL